MSKKASKKATKKASGKKTAGKKTGKPKTAAAKKAGSGSKAPSAKPSTVMRDRAITHAQFAHKMIEKFASGFADDGVTRQAPGCPNHVLWTLGHLAATASWGAGLVDGKPHTVPAGYEKLFGMGSTPVDDRDAYPPFAEVKKAFDDTFARVMGAVSTMTDAELCTPCTADSGGFMADKLDCLSKLAWHEGWHLGQLADLRRALGMPSAMS